MNPNTPYNSGSLKNMVAKVRTYCNKILPLVFDNTLSYYESICAFSAKVNELCDAVNAQNLTIVEFTHEVEIELDRFEKYIQSELDTVNETLEDHDDRITINKNNIRTLAETLDADEDRITALETDMTSAKSDITDIQNNLTTIQGAIADIRLNIEILVNAINQKVGWSDVVNSVLEGDTHPVTSGAVYDAIEQGGGGGGFVPDATTSSKGIVQIGDNINVNAGVISVPSATTSSKGAVQVGDNINVSNGKISVPDATHLVKGVVTPGAGLSINPVTPGVMTLNTATENVIGGVKVGDSLSVENDGTLSVTKATTSDFGVVKVGENLTIDSNDKLVVKDAQPSLVKGAVTIDGQTSNLSLLNGVLDVPTGSKNNKGVLQVGSNLTVSGGEVNVATAIPDTKGVVTIDSIDSNLSLSYGVLDAKIATRNHAGVVKPGDNIILNNDGEISVAVAQLNTKGLMKVTDASRLSLGADGALDAKLATTTASGVVTLTDTITDGDTTHVPTADAVYDAITGQTPPQIADATTTSKGIVQIGDNINVSNGVISVPNAGANTSGVVKVDSSTPLYMNTQTNTINIKDGSTTAKGALQVGSNLSVSGGVVDVPTATSSTKGILSVDDTNGLTISSGVLGVQPATHGQWGVAKIGSNLNVDQYGIVDLAPADASNLGGVKVGSNLNITSAGVLSVADGGINSKGVLGVNNINGLTVANGIVGINQADELGYGTVMIGDNITSNNGLISVPDAGVSTPGVVTVGDNISVTDGEISVPDADSTTKGVVKKTTSITSGSTDVPTSGAVYNAVSGIQTISKLSEIGASITNAVYDGFSTNPTSRIINFANNRCTIQLANGSITSGSIGFIGVTLRPNTTIDKIILCNVIFGTYLNYSYSALSRNYNDCTLKKNSDNNLILELSFKADNNITNTDFSIRFDALTIS